MRFPLRTGYPALLEALLRMPPISNQKSSAYRQLLRWLLATALPRRLFLTHGKSTSREVCLTFDDGPHPEYTPALLDVLWSYRVAATFFVVGQQAEKHPDLVGRMAAEGHVIANHSHTHARPEGTTACQLLQEVQATEEVLARVLGLRPRLVRPPYGRATPAKLWKLWRTGHAVVLWNVDPRDFACGSSADLRAWFDQHPLRGGDLVLLHDVCPHAADALPGIIEQARRSGLKFTTAATWAGRAYFPAGAPAVRQSTEESVTA
jgi:peptidoglycan/xylan/chitin deacetylase (PgdA/CDA1 family)